MQINQNILLMLIYEILRLEKAKYKQCVHHLYNDTAECYIANTSYGLMTRNNIHDAEVSRHLCAWL